MELSNSKEKIVETSFFALLLAFFGYRLSSSAEITVESVTGFFILLAYGEAIIVTVFWSRREGLKTPVPIGIAAIIYSVVNAVWGDSFTTSSDLLALSAGFLGTAITAALLETAYRRQESWKTILTSKKVGTSLTIGGIHLVIAGCTYMMAYPVEQGAFFPPSLKLISGLIGSFLLTAAPVYLYLDKGHRLPLLGAGAWIIWGIYSFIQNLGTYPVSMFFAPEEFMLPNNEAYFFSGMLFVSILIIYEHLRQTKEE